MHMGLESDSDDPESPIESNPLSHIRPEILASLQHLDLSGLVSVKAAKFIGAGAYGDVFRASYKPLAHSKIRVVVKRLRFYLVEDIICLFEKEIYVWSKLQHKNVLPLLGYAFDEQNGYPMLVSEWMTNGSALNYVKRTPNCDLFRMINGIARGLAYLHECSIVHSDIKPDNVVVNSSGEPCICDFGGSRIAVASRSLAKPSTGLRGTSRYLAHELVAVFDDDSGHTTASDVWAFGMTIFALVAQEHPFANCSDAQVVKAIAGNEVPSFDAWTSNNVNSKDLLSSICLRCWEIDPTSRISMKSVVNELEKPHE